MTDIVEWLEDQAKNRLEAYAAPYLKAAVEITRLRAAVEYIDCYIRMESAGDAIDRLCQIRDILLGCEDSGYRRIR